MSLNSSQWTKLTRIPGAIAPYRWRAEYRGGGRLRQFDVDGIHHSHEVERSRVTKLVLEGHPAGEIGIEASRDLPVDQVVIMCRNRIRLRGRWQRRYRWVIFGFRYGRFEDLIIVNDRGEIGRWEGKEMLSP